MTAVEGGQVVPAVMGIVNVTPDSFFVEGRTEQIDAAIERGADHFANGAAIVDVGGESSRPGARSVPEEREIERVVPVILALSSLGRVSVDTVKPGVARAAVAAGASLLNDVSGTLAPVAADLGVGWVAMHAQGTPATMQADPHYDDVVAEVRAWLEVRATEARSLGVDELWLDPGIGFGKSFSHNWSLLRHTDEMVALAHSLGARVLVGTSRKRFLGEAGGSDLGPEERLAASLATAVAAMASGADMVRSHDVKATVQAARVFSEKMVP